MDQSDQTTLVTLTADIVASHVSNNSVAIGDIANLVKQVHGALAGLVAKQEPEPEARQPAVSIRASIKQDSITCLVCGRKQSTLKRHLSNAHGMTPAQYREAFGLSADYPMTAPAYSEMRRQMAKTIGLGTARGGSKRRGRASKAKTGSKK